MARNKQAPRRPVDATAQPEAAPDHGKGREGGSEASSSSSSSSSSESSSDDRHGGGKSMWEADESEGFVQAQFEIFDAREHDVMSVRVLLKRAQKLLESTEGNRSGRNAASGVSMFADACADVLCNDRDALCSLIKSTDLEVVDATKTVSEAHADGANDDAIGLIGILQNGCEKHARLLSAFASLIGKAGNESFMSALGGRSEEELTKHMNVLLIERLVNLPVQLIPPLLECFVSELTGAVGERAAKAMRIAYICEAYSIVLPSLKKQKKKRKTSQPSTSEGTDRLQLHFMHQEDQALYERAISSQVCSGNGADQDGASMSPMTVALVLDVECIQSAINDVKLALG
ncbi:Protein BCP1 [Porphyridium purpureum]|uniref:Protein BCP1 n=1 Tax=Porphyridium purpureum TaxID=35688 RepID=A0A5J4YMW6_PORPP|nr:Protein BCP1 [Porphyridium purpureum]|eukprot:POR8779..scf244_11